MISLQAISCKKISEEKQSIALNNAAAFDWFEYKGKDSIYFQLNKTENDYLNPILSGFNPDPSICKANDAYYLITSSFTYFPGMPIYKSTDLVNWKLIGHVITRESQADFSGAGISRGMFAPTIRYHKGTFYVICTNVSGVGNFIVTTKNPKGEWSDPIALPEIDGIDPDIFFDDDGKVYITHNGPPPNNEPKHDGHRAIYTWEFDLENQKISSEQHLLVNGGTDMAKKPVWIEAPHIFKKEGFYYLICAEGGTAYNHSEVVFRSKNVFGPYESYKGNPILTQRHLPQDRPNQITTTGHADFVELPNGDWWAVYLGCRPYNVDYYNTGRETFLLPVTWKDGWPTFEEGKEPHPFIHKRPELPLSQEPIDPLNGNFTWKDDFAKDSLNLHWNFIRTPKETWYTIHDNHIFIEPREDNIHTQTNFSFIGRRQQHLQFEVSTKFVFENSNPKQAAGLVAFQNEKHYLFIGKRINAENKQEVFLEETNDDVTQILAVQDLGDNQKELFVKIEGDIHYYSFYCKTNPNQEWKPLKEMVDASLLSTKEAGGFVGTYLGMYASSNHFIK